MPRYRIPRNNLETGKELPGMGISLDKNCTDDEPTICAESTSTEKKTDVVVSNPQLIPQPLQCDNWFPGFAYLNDGKQSGEMEKEKGAGQLATSTDSEEANKFICENLRGYYIPYEEGKYSVSNWSALDQSSTETTISEILLEEIALEGLDGITFQALWERLKARFSKEEISYECQNFFWEIIKQIPFIMFYQLPEPRSDLQPLYRDKYKDERGNSYQPAWVPEEIYVYEPIVDKKKSVRGSAPMYRKRKCKSKLFVTKTFEEITRIGNRFVMVAPQHVRENVLFAEDHDEEYPLAVSQYCMLERIGRSRHEGEQTKGNVSLCAMKLENKSAFHYRKDLLELGVFTRQTYAMKFASAHTQSWISIFHLPWYFTQFETVPVRNVKQIILELRLQPNHFQEYFTIQKKFGKQTMKFISDPLISHILQSKEESQHNLFPEMYENIKSESKKALFRKRKIRVLCLTEAQVREGEIDSILRKIQENNIPKNERIVEEYDEENDDDADENLITEDESMLYKLLVYLHESGGLGVTLEEVAVHFSIGKLDARTSIRSVQRKKCIKSYWEGKGRTKCRRYYLSKFSGVHDEIREVPPAANIKIENLQLNAKAHEDEFMETEAIEDLVQDQDRGKLVKLSSKIVNYNVCSIPHPSKTESTIEVDVPFSENREEDIWLCTNEAVTVGEVMATEDDNEFIEERNVVLQAEYDSVMNNEMVQEEDDEIVANHGESEDLDIQTNSSKSESHDIHIAAVDEGIVTNLPKFSTSDLKTSQKEKFTIIDTTTLIAESHDAFTPTPAGQSTSDIIKQGNTEVMPMPLSKKRRKLAFEILDLEDILSPNKKKKPIYDEIDRAAIQKRKKQRVEWTAEEDHCILIIFVASVVFIPNYVLGKTFIFNAAQVRDLLHKNIRDSANKTQTAVRRRLHFLMKQRKFNARYRYYLSATFSDDRVFKFVERHINQFKKPGRGFLEISVSALSAVYTYIMTHFVGINAFNEEDEHFIDAPSFGQLTALRSYRRSEISEEFMNAEDDLTGDNSEMPNSDIIRQKEKRKEWSLRMCKMKARQVHPNPADFLYITDCLLWNYLSLHENFSPELEYDGEMNNVGFGSSYYNNGHQNIVSDHYYEKIEEEHVWRTERKKSYWEKNVVLGVNEPRNISDILIWRIRTLIMRILLTSKNAKTISNYLSKLPEYYLDYIVHSLREMEITSHSKRGTNVRLNLLAAIYRGPYPNDYNAAQTLDNKCASGGLIMMDDRTRCGTFLCIVEWVMRNVAKFNFEYSDVVVGVKAEWKDVFQLLISEEFGFKVYMKKSNKRQQLLRNLIFDEDVDVTKRAEYLNDFICSIKLPPLSQDPEDDSKFTRLHRLDNFRRKLEYLSKILAKFRRRKNKQVDWGVYLKREQDIKEAKLEGKPLSKMVNYSGMEFDSDEDGERNFNSTRKAGNLTRKSANSGLYDDDDKDSNDEEDEVSSSEEDEDEEESEELSNALKISFTELVNAKGSIPDLKFILNKINVNLAVSATVVYYSDEINKVIDERLEDIRTEEETVHEVLKSKGVCFDNAMEKLNYRNKVHSTNYDEVEVLAKRLSSFSMANEFLSMEEPTVFVKNEPPQPTEGLQSFKDYDFSHLTTLTKDCPEMIFVKQRLRPIILLRDLRRLKGLKLCLREDSEIEHNISESDGGDLQKTRHRNKRVYSTKYVLGRYYELFKVIRITEEIGISLELLKTLFSREYLKQGLASLMEYKFIFLVGVHERKFISAEFIDSWSMPVKLMKYKFIKLNTPRRYIVHPWISGGGQIEWKLVIKLLTLILSHMDTVSVTVDDICRSMAPILSTVETLLLIECLVEFNIASVYSFEDCGKTTLWTKPTISHYESRLQDFDKFLDLENLYVKLGPQYFKRFCDVQAFLNSLDAK